MLAPMAMAPSMLLYAAAGTVGLGLLVVVVALASKPKKDEMSDVAKQVAMYGAMAERPSAFGAGPDAGIGEQATAVAAQVLANNRNLEARIAQRLDGAGSKLKPAEWILVHVSIVIISAVLGLLLTGNLAMMVLTLLFGAVGPWVFLGLKRGKRLKRFQEMLPDALQLMAGSLSAGLSLAQSVDTIVKEGQEPLVSEFRRVVVETRLGVSLEDSMEGITERMESDDWAWVVMAIRIQREVGGNLSELLLSVAETLREREYVRRHVRALSAEGRLSCYVLGGLPPAFVAFLMVSKWDYIAPIFTTTVGYLMLGTMVVLEGVGMVWMTKVAKVEL